MIASSTLLSTLSFAQISESGPTILNCDFSKAYPPSEQLATLAKSKNLVAHCANSNSSNSFEIEFLNVIFKEITPETDTHSANLTLRCTGESVAGVYKYGGLPPGFETKANPKAPFFYNTTTPGRCFLENNKAITGSIEAEIGVGVMVLMQLTSAAVH